MTESFCRKFLIQPWSQRDGEEHWIVFRDAAVSSNCVALCANKDEALSRAVAMAEYQHAAGNVAQVLGFEPTTHDWQILWQSPGSDTSLT